MLFTDLLPERERPVATHARALLNDARHTRPHRSTLSLPEGSFVLSGRHIQHMQKAPDLRMFADQGLFLVRPKGFEPLTS